MKKTIKKHLLLEQLEERVFLNANPIAAVEHVDSVEAVTVVEHIDLAADAASDTASTQPAGEQEIALASPVDSAVVDSQTGETSVGGDVVPTGAATAPDAATASAGEDATTEDSHQADASANLSGETSSEESGTVDQDVEATTTGGDDIASDDSEQPDVAAGATDSEDTADQADVASTVDEVSADSADNGVDPDSAVASLDSEQAMSAIDDAIDPMVGDDFTFNVSFDNDTGSTVYGPYIDMVLEGGEDANDTGGFGDDGITFSGATYLGTTVDSVVVDITADGQVVDHPWATDNTGAPLQVTAINGHTFEAGDQFVALRLPFGSFADDQPSAEVEVTAHMGANADVDVNLAVHTTTGATLGLDPLDNPGSDNPLRDLQQSTQQFKPELITYHKTIISLAGVSGDCQPVHDPAHDDVRQWADDLDQVFEENSQDIPTGPNYPFRYTAVMDVANTQTVSGVQLVEQLEDGVVFTGINSVQVGGAAAAYTHSYDAVTRQLTVTLTNDVTGTAVNDDVRISYDFYVADQTSQGTDVLDPDTGALSHVVNDGEVHYSWISPDNAAENITNAVIDAEVNADGHFSSNPDVDDISHSRSLAIQKGHAMENDVSTPGYGPGDRVEFTLNFEISDYFSFDNIIINDVLGDGMTLETAGAYTAEIEIYERGGALIAARDITAGEMTVATEANGDTTVAYDVSQMLMDDGYDGLLEGGYTDGHTDGATRGTITYWAVIDNEYDNTNPGEGEGNIDQGDWLTGGAKITGEVYDYATAALNGNIVEGTSCDIIEMATGSLTKDIYSVNHQGVADYAVGNNPHLSPGDTVTYHLHYTMPMSSTEDFKITDYLPLPVFDAADPDLDGILDTWVFNNTLFDGTAGTGAPAVGEWAYTVDDTYHIVGDSTVSVAAGTGNSLVFDYGEYHDPEDDSSVIDLVFTVKISSEPFADGMLLTNQARAIEAGTSLTENPADSIIQIVLDEPVLDSVLGIQKDAAPVSGVDAGDAVDFTITVNNSGVGDAYDTIIKDTLPDGFIPETANFVVETGTGVELIEGVDFTWVGGGLDGDINTAQDNFFSDATHDGGIELIDSGGAGKLAGGESLVITYTLVAEATLEPGHVMTNTASVTNYAGAEGGPDHTLTDLADDASVDTLRPTISKDIISTSEASTDGNNVIIGETVTYTVTLTVPEGEINDFRLTDTLDDGLAIVSIDSIAPSSGDLTTDHAGGWNGILTEAQANQANAGDLGVGIDGHDFNVFFGNLTNANRDNGTPETIVVTYTAVVLNVDTNQQSTLLDNQAQATWDDPDSAGRLSTALVDSADLVVQEADLQVLKQVWNQETNSWIDANNANSAVHYDAGDEIRYRIRVNHSAASHEDAFDAALTDALPADIDWSGATVNVISDSAGLTGGVTLAGNTISARWDSFASGTSTVFEVVGGQLVTATAGQIISNTAEVTWESLDSEHHDVGSEISTYNSNSGERTGDAGDIGGNANDYSDSDPAFVTVAGEIDKISPDPDNYTIGDTVTYTIHVTVPDGQTNDLVITDDLPAGMSYVANSATIVPGSFSGSALVLDSVTTNVDGDILFDMGDVVTANASNGTADNTFTITFEALVTDVPASHGDENDPDSTTTGTALTNSVSMSYTAPDGSTDVIDDPTDPTVHVVEPQITTVKSVVDSNDAGIDANPGETLTYTVRFTNTGGADAFEVTADDALPDGVEFDAGSATVVDSSDVLNATDVTATLNGAGDAVAFTNTDGGWDIAVGGFVEIQYTVTVMAAGFVSGGHDNTIDADWSSQDGTGNPEDRVYDDSGTSPLDGTQDEATATFNVITTASVGDQVFFDADGDGGEFSALPGDTTPDVGLSGVDVTITADVDGDGIAEYTQTVRTDVDGNYTFDNLEAFDNYVITVDPATTGGTDPLSLNGAGFTQTYDLDGTGTPHSVGNISLIEGQDRTDVDFGYTGANTVGDTVWYDADADGVQDPGEDGIGGLTVTLTADIDGDGIDEYTATTITDQNGVYHFDHLPAGEYDITVTPPADSTATYDFDGTTATPDNTTPFTLGADDDRDNIDFGIRGTGSIGDFVWFDGDANGAQNDGLTSGLGGVKVTLSGDYDNDGTIDYTTETITADDGSYLFDNLLGGEYMVTIDTTTLSDGMVQSYDLDDNTGAFVTPDSSAVTLADGQDREDVDFGYTGTGSLGDRVWLDLNDDGVQDGTELGLANVEVQITADLDGDGVDEYTATTTTDANGEYRFENLAAADYTVTVNTTTFVGGSAAVEQTYDLDDGTGAFATADSTAVTLGIDAGTGLAEDIDNVDFGYIGTGSIGDFVWYDANNNGLHDDGPISGLAGVTVTLTGDFNNDGDATNTYTTVTDANGEYLFENLFGGEYTVTVDQSTLPGGTDNWSQSYDLDDGTGGAFATTDSSGSMDLGINGQSLDRTDADFGYVGNSSIGNLVFFDADHSGDFSAGDTGITNLGVMLTADVDGDGVVDYTWTTTTDGNGEYLFDDLPDLTTIYPAFEGYEVTIDPANLPPHSEQSYDLDGVSPEHVTSDITLGINEDRDDVDFGYVTVGTGSIGDTVWYDADADGVQDAGEQGLAGVELQLVGDITGDGVTDVTYTTTTDENGNYIFDELLLGTYTVSVISRPDGMEETFDLDGLGTADEASLALADGEQNNNVDFGYTGSADIGDTIFFDAAADGGPYDPLADGTLAGVTVTLTGDVNNDGVEDTLTTTTDANGHYLFENLRDGDYQITVNPADLPAGMDQTADPDGVNDNTSLVTIAGGLDDLDQDFGYSGSGTIGDRIWNDVDGNGVQDGGETGLNGVDVTISVDFDGDGVVDYTQTVTTAGDGDYSFENLPAGSYTVEVDTATVPANSVLTGDPDNNLDSTSIVNLPAGGTNEDQDFGYHDTGAATGSIGDTVWFDSNGDGNQAAGVEPGIAGVTVTLTGDIDSDGDIDTVTTTTDANGHYKFENLAAGDYSVTVDSSTLPDGMVQTADPQGAVDNAADVILAVGEDVDTVDFGYNGTGSIGDTIFFDGNNDGSQDSNEGGIAGVEVTLELDLDGDGVTDYTETDTTDEDGHYQFDDLPAGDYTITVDPAGLPAGMQQSADPDSSLDNQSALTLSGGENNLDQDFGYTGSGSIGDTIWNDVDNDGTLNGSETGLAGVDVTLEADIDGDGVPDYEVTVTTDGNGNYEFTNLPAGTYTVSVDPGTLPAGMNPVADPDGVADNTTTVNLAADENNEDIDFGYNSGTASIGDTIYFDEDGNGTQDGTEGGLAGVTVTLTGDINGDGVQDTLTTTTDSNGKYVFENLAAGDYTVTVDQTTLPAGMNPTADLDGDGTPDTSSSVTLAAAENNVDQDFGFQGTGSIGDTIWDDTDGNGVQDGTESGLGGVDVTLEVDFDGDGIVDYTMTDTTDGSGHYSFDNIPAGSYTVKVDTSDIPTDYDLTGDPDSNLDSTATVDLAPGETINDQDFGYHDTNTDTGSIGDTIWFDADGDGVDNDGPTSGLGGVTVTLTGDIDGDGNPDTVTTTTDADGKYLFDNLPAGDYSISVDTSTLPGGMVPTADLDGDSSPDNASSVTLAAGEDNTDQDFGYTGTGEIGDTLYVDTDGDGIEDPGEGGLAGVDVTISVDLDGDGIAEYTETVTTDPDGHYSFTNLPEGEYTISVDPASLPGDVVNSGDPDGTLDNTTVVDLGAGETNQDIDFGFTGTGSIGDTIFYDADGNGFQSSGESGLGGVTVTLQGDFDGDGTIDSLTTTTDSQGHYLFEHLRAGDYTIYVDTDDLPTGMTQTGDPDGTLDDQATVTLTPGEQNMDQDFGYTGTGEIGDTLYVDTNGDGIEDPGEDGLAGVDVTISVDFDGDGIAEYTKTVTTDPDGHYSFTNLPEGEYTISVDPASLPGDVVNSGDPDGTPDNVTVVDLGAGETNQDIDFGYTGSGSIGDTIFYDADGNGFQSTGENGLGGVRVTLQGDFDGDGTIDSLTTTTDSQGHYLFEHLWDGDYTIYVDTDDLPTGMTQTGDPDGTLDDQATVTLTPGGQDMDQDFGYTGSGSIGDTIFYDADGNGFQSSGESGLGGVRVTLQGDFDGDGTIDSLTTTTDSQGHYLFEHLRAGDYTIYVDTDDLPTGMTQTGDPDGTLDDQVTVTLTPGEQNMDQDFGYTGPKPFLTQQTSTPQLPGAKAVITPTPQVEDEGFVPDSLFMRRYFGSNDQTDLFGSSFTEIPWQPLMVPVSPIYSGHAEPGTTLEFILYDAEGNQIAQQSVMADAAGNWLASFPGAVMYDMPHHMAIEQTSSSYNGSTPGFFNMRTYYSPNFSSMVFSSTRLDVDTIFAYMPSTVMESMHSGNMGVLSVSWDDFDAYEFSTASTHPASHGH